MVLLEQISTVNKGELEDYVGYIDDEKSWISINIAVKKTFGLWMIKKARKGDIRCLCPKCLKDFMSNPNYIVHRLDPLSSTKDICDKCQNMGYDYVVYDKRMVLGKRCKNA